MRPPGRSASALPPHTTEQEAVFPQHSPSTVHTLTPTVACQHFFPQGPHPYLLNCCVKEGCSARWSGTLIFHTLGNHLQTQGPARWWGWLEKEQGVRTLQSEATGHQQATQSLRAPSQQAWRSDPFSSSLGKCFL
jgi:hypothetical protein